MSVKISEPSLYLSNTEDILYFSVRRSVITKIVNSDVYPWFYLSECGNIDSYIVSYVRIGKQIIGEMETVPPGDPISIYATFPKGSIERYSSPCIQLRGSGYFMNSVESDYIPLKNGTFKKTN
jgi:hypothetical protein